MLAGGTDLMVDVNLRHLRPRTVVSLNRLDELRERSERWVGAAVTFGELEHSPHRAMAQLARTVGSPQIRSVATLGGNLATASPAGDALPWLAVLEASVVVASTLGQRTVAWDEFLVGPKETALLPGEVIVGVDVPSVPDRQAFAKVGARNAMTIAVVSCCAVRTTDGGVRIALGAVGPTPIRASRAESFLGEQSRWSKSVLDEASRLVADDVRPIDDHRSTAAYRRHAAGVLARRTLERVAS